MLDCSFEAKCSGCYNQGKCTEDTCLGYVPMAKLNNNTIPYISLDNTQCRTDCPYIQACYKAEEEYEEEKFMQK